VNAPQRGIDFMVSTDIYQQFKEQEITECFTHPSNPDLMEFPRAGLLVQHRPSLAAGTIIAQTDRAQELISRIDRT